jgi:hypothetical protein
VRISFCCVKSLCRVKASSAVLVLKRYLASRLDVVKHDREGL